MSKKEGKYYEKLRPHQDELIQLSDLAGIHLNHKVFQILVELLNMGVDPFAIHRLLNKIYHYSNRSKHAKDM